MTKRAPPSHRKLTAEALREHACRRAIEKLKSMAGKVAVEVDLHRSRRRPGAKP